MPPSDEQRESHDQTLLLLGRLDGAVQSLSLVTQQTHDRVLFLERELLPLLGKRAALIGAGSAVATTAAAISALYYLKALFP